MLGMNVTESNAWHKLKCAARSRMVILLGFRTAYDLLNWQASAVGPLAGCDRC